MPELNFCALPTDANLLQALIAFNLLRLLEKETMEMFSIGERRKRKVKKRKNKESNFF